MADLTTGEYYLRVKFDADLPQDEYGPDEYGNVPVFIKLLDESSAPDTDLVWVDPSRLHPVPEWEIGVHHACDWGHYVSDQWSEQQANDELDDCEGTECRIVRRQVWPWGDA